MKNHHLFFLLLLFNTSLLISQSSSDSESVFYKKSLTLYLRDIGFEGGVGGTFWFNPKYSLLLILNGSAEGQTYSINTNHVTKSNIYINPIVTVRRHVYEKNNLTPFVGITLQPTWYIGEVSKRTEFLFGAVFGVESWLTENISLTGEQSVLNSIPINDPWDYHDTFGRSSISLSFYY